MLGVLVNAVDYEAALAAILDAARARRGLGVSALAVHGVMTGVLDRCQRHRLNSLDLVVPDGQPVRWALNLCHGTRLPDRVYGPRLMELVCAAAAQEGLPVFLYGSRPEVLSRLQERLGERFPGLVISGALPSSFRRLTPSERDEIAGRIRDSGAALVFVGLGCPRQETWVYEHAPLLAMPRLAVGAAFEFLAELTPQAPPAWQRRGFEWLYRLLREPRRLWRRYLLLNPLFLVLLLAQLVGMGRLAEGRSPSEEQRPG